MNDSDKEAEYVKVPKSKIVEMIEEVRRLRELSRDQKQEGR